MLTAMRELSAEVVFVIPGRGLAALVPVAEAMDVHIGDSVLLQHAGKMLPHVVIGIEGSWLLTSPPTRGKTTTLVLRGGD